MVLPMEIGCGLNRCMAKFVACAGLARRSNRERSGPGMPLVKPRARGVCHPEPTNHKKGFLLNHVIAEELPSHAVGEHVSNSDPITGQAGWYDVKVRVYKADKVEPNQSFPQFDPLKPLPGMERLRGKWQGYFAGKFAKSKRKQA